MSTTLRNDNCRRRSPLRRFSSPVRRKAVTIGVGFLCEDGIVLCADNQITWPQSHKYYECKIYEHRTNEWSMLNTFSGDPDLVKSFNGKFRDAMSKIASLNFPLKLLTKSGSPENVKF